MDKALEAFQEAVAIEPFNPIFQNDLGNALINILEYEEAIDSYKMAIMYDPKVTDESLYNDLIDAAEESTRRNESLGDLRARIEAMGSSAIRILKEVIGH